MPLISVLMPTYRESRDALSEAVSSILHQSLRDFELIIVIDDPENDEAVALLQTFAAKDDRIILLPNESNLGIAQSLNRAIDRSAGQFICRMDSDDVSMPQRLETQHAYLVNHDVDLIGGRMQVINEAGAHMYTIPQPPQGPESINKALKWNNCLPHPTWFGKREIFAQKYRDMPLCEDYDFLLRAALQGVRLGNCSDCILKYRMSSKSISRQNLFEQFLYQRFITNEYSHGRVPDINLAKQYVAKHNNPRKANRYMRSNERFNQALDDLRGRRFIKCMSHGMMAVAGSTAYTDKIIRLGRATAINGK